MMATAVDTGGRQNPAALDKALDSTTMAFRNLLACGVQSKHFESEKIEFNFILKRNSAWKCKIKNRAKYAVGNNFI